MNLFLDSHIWLAFYDSPRRVLEELGKLVCLVRLSAFCDHLLEVRLVGRTR